MEYWDLYDRNGKKTGETVTRGSALPEGTCHLVVDVWIRNAEGKYLISRRCPDKFPDPGLWEPTCGSVVAGENSFDAALREVREELGLQLNPARGRCVARMTVPNHTLLGAPNRPGTAPRQLGASCLVDVWLFEQEADETALILQPGETDAAQWADTAYIRALMDEGKFLPRHRLPYLDALLDGVSVMPPLMRVCLMTHNIAAMVDFYTKVCAAKPEVDGDVDFRFPGAQLVEVPSCPRTAIRQLETSCLVVFRLTDAEETPTHHAALIFDVADPDAEYARLAALGLAEKPPTDKPWGVRSFMITDPDGNSLSFAKEIIKHPLF